MAEGVRCSRCGGISVKDAVSCFLCGAPLGSGSTDQDGRPGSPLPSDVPPPPDPVRTTAGGAGWSIRPQRDTSDPLFSVPEPANPNDVPLTGLPPLPGAKSDTNSSYLLQPSGKNVRSDTARRGGVRNLGLWTWGGTVVIVCALVAIALFGGHNWLANLIHPTHSLGQPAKIGSYQLVGKTLPAALTDAARSSVGTGGTVTHTEGGTYARPATGQGLALELSFVAVEGVVQPESRSTLSGYLSSLAQSMGGSVDQSRVVFRETNGVTYYCGIVAGEKSDAAVCGWNEYDTTGVVVSDGKSALVALDDVQTTHDASVH